MKIERKTIMVVIAVLTAIAAVFQQQFGLSIELTTAIAGLASLLIYVFAEAKKDIARIKDQSHRWLDPKFWLAIIAAVLAVLNEQLGLNLPAEAIITVLTIIMAILFKTNVATK